MQSETRTVAHVLATIVLIVTSSFAGVGYLANRAILARTGTALSTAPDVQQVEQRAGILLAAAIVFWLAASLVFARVLPHRPEQGARSYVTATVLVTIAIALTVGILHFTAGALKLF